ncbi:MAG: helix-turn-helix transcriptional regulator [Deltaproteobacteria bacterium]|nr:helix-turn-helix transcriptional regulator [Deltaproteobacteria bacterium]
MRSDGVAAALKSIAANTRRLRRLRGWTQEKLAEVAKLEPRYVRTVESGRANPSAAVLVALAQALAVKPGVLFRPARLVASRPGRPRLRRPRTSRPRTTEEAPTRRSRGR